MKIAITLLALLSLSSSVMAEIYQCKQKDGRSSFSNTPCPSQVLNGTSETHDLWRKMNALVKEGAEISSNMGPDYHSILACNEKSEAYNVKLSEVNKTLNTLSPKTHKKMYLAMESLRECGSCRASSTTYCKKASTSLMAETKTLALLSH
jgi:hypothetical protein